MSALCTVVNLHAEAFDVYIGRGHGSIYGNPFTHLKHAKAAIVVPTREDAVIEYDLWLNGDLRWASLEPARREQILAKLPRLAGRKLGCYCHPLPCHGDVLARRVNALCLQSMAS